MYLCFSVHKLSEFSSNTGKVNFEGLVHSLGCISDNKNLGLKYYSRIEDAPISDLLRHSSIKSENQFMVSSDSSCQDCPDTGRITGSYIVFYQGGPIDHCTHVPVQVSHSSSESDYIEACTVEMLSSHFIMLNNELVNKDPDVVT